MASLSIPGIISFGVVEAMIILGIDPGNVKSSFAIYDSVKKKPVFFQTLFNGTLNFFKNNSLIDLVVIEKVACYGMAVGETIFETVFWTGKYVQQLEDRGFKVIRLPRSDVKMQLCGNMRAKDSNIIQTLKDKFGDKGTKKNPGVLYGIKADEWQALAIAVTYAETMSLD
jgi:Holliday junction resolvasome RuvABC endonuclease subunit